jgi:MFS family permease
MFLVSRFAIAFGLIFCNTYAPILIGELAHPKDHQVVTSLNQTTYYVGATMAAWVTFGTFSMSNEWGWRIPSLLQAAPACIQLIGVCFVPESPRWLIAVGRAQQARSILVKYHGNGEESNELVNLSFEEIRAVIQADMANKTSWSAFWWS